MLAGSTAEGVAAASSVPAYGTPPPYRRLFLVARRPDGPAV